MEALQTTGVVAALIMLILVNTLGIGLVVFQLPGTWLIVAATTGVAWWRQDQGTISVGVLIALVVIALIGEAIEMIAGPAGSAKAGGSKRGAVLAVVGALVGAVLGTPVMPVIGTIFGACAGAAVGSILGDRWAGRQWSDAKRAAQGAATGRLIGTLVKIGCAVLMWLIALISVVVS